MGYVTPVEGWRSVEECFNKYVQTGCFLNDQNLAWILWNENRDTIKELADWGAQVNYRSRTNVAMIGGRTQMFALINELTRHPNITLMEYCVITKLITHGGSIAGATGLDLVTGEFILFKAKAVIIATGGFGQLFYPSECMPLGMPTGVTGDGIVISYHSGAELCDLEFIQQAWIATRPRCFEAWRQIMGSGFRVAGEEGPYFDKDGNVLVSREELHEMNPFGGYSAAALNRVYKEMRKQPVYIDLIARKDLCTQLEPDKIIGLSLENMKEWGLDKMEVALGPLDTSGGLRVNERCELASLDTIHARSSYVTVV